MSGAIKERARERNTGEKRIPWIASPYRTANDSDVIPEHAANENIPQAPDPTGRPSRTPLPLRGGEEYPCPYRGTGVTDYKPTHYVRALWLA